MARGHPGFATLWDFLTRHEAPALRALRRETIGGATGRTLEVGVGVGASWKYLPEGIAYTGIEPDPYMLERARRHALEQGRGTLALEQVDVQRMPFPDETFDTVVTTLTFCSVPDALAGLREVRRVLKPGGEFRFAEHVRARNRVLAGLQRAITPLTRRCAGGCHQDRDTLATIHLAGFTVVSSRRERHGPTPMIVGVARKDSASG
jgi:ubiquinone/menaquinone biosynthesis C-methylase UbiE